MMPFINILMKLKHAWFRCQWRSKSCSLFIEIAFQLILILPFNPSRIFSAPDSWGSSSNLSSCFGSTSGLLLPISFQPFASQQGEKTFKFSNEVTWFHNLILSAMDWIFVCSHTSYVETLIIPKVLVFRGGASEGHEGEAPVNGISVLMRHEEDDFLPGEHTMRWQPPTNQEGGQCQKLKGQVPWSWTYQSPELREINFCCLSYLVHGNLL